MFNGESIEPFLRELISSAVFFLMRTDYRDTPSMVRDMSMSFDEFFLFYYFFLCVS